jgi:pimeloyl-ACP methyl ester carboxylesterase
VRRTRGGIAYFTGGTGDSLLLLLHGLGATAAVWRQLLPLVQDSWDGRWAAPDLRGHGLSVAEPPYGYAVHAADIAELAAELSASRVTVLGHSFGGVVGAVLGGGWYGVEVARVAAVGVKIDWTDDEVARARAMSARPPQVFVSAAEAADRHLRLAGLRELVDPADPVARPVRGSPTAAGSPPSIRGRSAPWARRWRRSCPGVRRRCGSQQVRPTRWSASRPCDGWTGTPC